MINYINDFSNTNVLLAQGKDLNFLLLEKLNDKRTRFDGISGEYLLEYSWLSCPCEKETDQSYVCIKGSEVQIYTKKELENFGIIKNRKIQDVNLFDVFDLL